MGENFSDTKFIPNNDTDSFSERGRSVSKLFTIGCHDSVPAWSASSEKWIITASQDQERLAYVINFACNNISTIHRLLIHAVFYRFEIEGLAIFTSFAPDGPKLDPKWNRLKDCKSASWSVFSPLWLIWNESQNAEFFWVDSCRHSIGWTAIQSQVTNQKVMLCRHFKM